jgi:hypothetical protein
MYFTLFLRHNSVLSLNNDSARRGQLGKCPAEGKTKMSVV